MKSFLGIIILSFLFFTGCAKISPFNPELKQKIENQNGEIEDIKNNQNGLMLELGKVRNENELQARDIRDAQQGLVNLKGNENSGIQILQGDGALILIFALGTIGMMLVFYYRTKYIKSEKTTEILAQQIALYNDADLDDKVFMAALNTDVESNIYHTMVKSQLKAGKIVSQCMVPKEKY